MSIITRIFRCKAHRQSLNKRQVEHRLRAEGYSRAESLRIVRIIFGGVRHDN